QGFHQAAPSRPSFTIRHQPDGSPAQAAQELFGVTKRLALDRHGTYQVQPGFDLRGVKGLLMCRPRQGTKQPLGPMQWLWVPGITCRAMSNRLVTGRQPERF